MQGQLEVTPARWWHVPGLSRLIRETRRQRGVADAPGGALVWAPRWSPSLGLLQSVWSAPVPGMPGPRSFVAEQDGRPVGLAQMTPRREPRQWDVVYLAVDAASGAALSPAADGPRLWLVPDRRATRLLGELCDTGVLLGAERLFARIPEETSRFEVFRQVGFTLVVREYTYHRPWGSAEGLVKRDVAIIPGLRPQRRPDAFGLSQLYHACTPKVVQMAEGKRGAESWGLPASGLGTKLTRQAHVQRWVVEREARHVAWLQISTRRGGPPQLRLMVDDRASDLDGPLLEFALGRLGAHATRGVIVRVREHQPRLMGALEARGFEPVEGHLVMVKQLAARVMQRQLVPSLEKVV